MFQVYVSSSGNDSDSCGPLLEPCRSIVQAVSKVDPGGIILLNGSGTEQHAYDCSFSSVARDHHPGIYISKNLSMKSSFSVPRISCIDGFHFQKSDWKEQPLQFEISGIIFEKTTLTFEDCSNVKIFNCSFHESLVALTIHIRKVTRFSLDIRGSSLFWNNSLCVHFVLSDDIRTQDRYAVINVTDTHFLENGHHSGGLSRVGVIEVTDKGKTSGRLYLDVFCNNVKCIRNRGSFLNNDIVTAVTRELYKNVQLNFNQGILSRFSDSNSDPVGSLYSSQAMKLSATFIDVHCIHNMLLRCIAVTSDDIEIEIQTSQFIGQSAKNAHGGCVFLKSNGYVSLAISDTTFSRNKAKAGGAISINCSNGIVKLNFTNVDFTRCSSQIYGCAVLVGQVQYREKLSPYKLFANFTNVQVKRCSGTDSNHNHRCKSIYLLLKNGAVNVKNSTWSDNLKATAGALFVGARGGKVDVDVVDCTFVDNGAPKRSAVLSLLTLKTHSGNVMIVNTSFINKKKRQVEAMRISGSYQMKLLDITCMRFWSGLFTQLMGSRSVAKIYIDRCKFINNIKDAYIYLRDPSLVQLIIKSTILTSKLLAESGYALRIVIPPLRNVNISNAVIKLENNIFESKPSTGLALFFKGIKNVTVRNTTFRNCICFHPKDWKKYPGSSTGSFRETATGAISILTNFDEPVNFGCIESNTANDTHPLYSYETHVLFEDTTFIDNLGLLVGGVYLTNGNNTFRGCTFRDNFSLQRAGHVYSAYGTGQVNFINCSFINRKEGRNVNKIRFDKASFFYSESEGPVHVLNTTMATTVDNGKINAFSVFEISNGGFVKMDVNSSIQCSTGYNLELDNNTHFVYTEKNKRNCRINITVLRYSCRLCGPGVYSLLNGASHGVLVDPPFKCLKCPFGANCVNRNIAAKPNFWGYPISNNSPQLRFSACPEHYCESPPSNSAQYNSCFGNRTGFLCGECLPGYSETLLSTECRKSTECNNIWMWSLTILLLTTGFVLYLLIKPPILSFLRTQIFWFRKRDEEQTRTDLGEPHDQSEYGFLKITFYFYQAAELLVVGSSEKLLHKINFLYAVVAVFNFKIQSLNDGIGCPFQGITAVTKQLILSATVLVTMAEVGVLFFLHFVFNAMRQKERPSLFHYMAVVLEILLLGYETLAETSLKLMYCVDIGSEKRLFFNGEVVCWQWWQYILLGYNAVFVVPFVLVLYYGSTRLSKSSISAGEFLGACILPLPFLMYWLLKKIFKKKSRNHENNEEIADVLEVLYGPFRQPNEDDNGAIYWESVLIGRRLIFLSCHAFIETPMLRMVCMTVTCVVMLLHHVLKNPYRNPIANKAETLSLLILVGIAVINLTKETLISFGTSIEGPAKYDMKILDWVEIVALAFVPALFAIFISFAVFSLLARLMTSLAKIISHWVPCPRLSLGFNSELQRPLLDVSEED